MTRILPVLVLFLLILGIGTVSATQTSTISQVSSFDTSATTGYVIDEVVVGPVPCGTNQTIIMYSGNQVQTLTITTWKQFTFDWKVHLDLNNGTSDQTMDLESWSLQPNYRVVIQPLYNAGIVGDRVLSVDLYIGTIPLNAKLNGDPLVIPGDYLPASSYTPLAFTRVTDNIRAVTDVQINQDTNADFLKLEQQNPVDMVTSAAHSVAQAALDGAWWLIGQVPVIGPFFLVFLDFAGTILTEGAFWLGYFFLHAAAVGLGVESVILMCAGLNGNFRVGKVVGLVAAYNLLCIQTLILVFNTCYDIIMKLLHALGVMK
jgi:hypothetical protein